MTATGNFDVAGKGLAAAGVALDKSTLAAECDVRKIPVARTGGGNPKETLESLKGKLLAYNNGNSVMPRLAPRDKAAGPAWHWTAAAAAETPAAAVDPRSPARRVEEPRKRRPPRASPGREADEAARGRRLPRGRGGAPASGRARAPLTRARSGDLLFS